MCPVCHVGGWGHTRSIIASAEPVWSETHLAYVNVELCGGADYLCGTCGPYRFRSMTQLFADILVPIVSPGRGRVEIGPYVKGALVDGHVPQIAGGMLLGYRIATMSCSAILNERMRLSGSVKPRFPIPVRPKVQMIWVFLAGMPSPNGIFFSLVTSTIRMEKG